MICYARYFRVADLSYDTCGEGLVVEKSKGESI
jgi:hypothetical protein